MDRILEQVRVARRRLSLQMFFAHAGWTLFGALTLSAIAVGVHSRYPTRVNPFVWNMSALAAGVVLGLCIAAVWTWWKRPSLLSAAAEIDRRFELRERISSSLALTPEEQGSDAGQAVMADALSRTQRIEVGSKFPVPIRRRLALPLAPVVVAILLRFVVPAQAVAPPEELAAQEAKQKQSEKSTEDLRKRIEKRQKEASEVGLKDAEDALKELQAELKRMQERGEKDPTKQLIELNRISDKFAERRQKLESSEKVRQQLRGMKDVKQGPADKMAQAMKQGKLGQAAAELEKLAQKAQDGGLDKQEQEKLAEQLNQMQQKLAEQAESHDQKMKDVQQQLDRAQQQGDQAAANRLQQQLDQMQQQSEVAQRMQEMAQKLSQAGKNMKEGNGQQAAKSLQQLADDLKQMQKENDQLQPLDQALDDIQMAKNAMNCDQCQGEGCQHCQGQKMGQAQQQQPGGGLKPGKGHIDSQGDDQEKPAGFFDTQVKQKVGRGASIVAGEADGPNAKGKVHDAIKAEFESKETGPADPLTNQRLQKAQRTHIEQYFKSMREGE